MPQNGRMCKWHRHLDEIVKEQILVTLGFSRISAGRLHSSSPGSRGFSRSTAWSLPSYRAPDLAP